MREINNQETVQKVLNLINWRIGELDDNEIDEKIHLQWGVEIIQQNYKYIEDELWDYTEAIVRIEETYYLYRHLHTSKKYVIYHLDYFEVRAEYAKLTNEAEADSFCMYDEGYLLRDEYGVGLEFTRVKKTDPRYIKQNQDNQEMINAIFGIK